MKKKTKDKIIRTAPGENSAQSVSAEELRFRDIAEAAGDAFYRLDYATMKYEYLSPVIERLTGYTPAEMGAKGFRTIIIRVESVSSIEVSREVFEQQRQFGDDTEYFADYLVRTKSGEERWISDRSYPWHNSTGALIGALGVLRDVTERKLVQQALRESEERFRKLIESSPDAIGVHCEGKIVFINSAAVRLFGARTEKDLMGTSIMDLVHPDYRKLVAQRVRGTQVEKRDMDAVEEKFVRLDGAVIDVEVTAVPITYMNKPATQLVVRDVTNKKLAEESLRRSRENYKAFIENSTEGIWIIEFDAPFAVSLPIEKQIEHLYDHSILSECNNAMARMYGYATADEVRGKRFGDLLDRTDTKNREFFLSFIRSGYHLENAETHELDKDGNPVFFLNNILGMVENGFLVRVWGSQRDITERKRLEQQLLQAQKMESLGTLAGGIAHDFNNILGIILGYATNLGQHIGDKEKLTQSIVAINKAVTRGASVVSQLLTFARRYDVVFKSVNVNEVIEELVVLLEETLPKSILIDVELDERIPPIIADHHQLHQAYMNLCLNARDAMSSSGTLRLKTFRISGKDLQANFADVMEEEYVAVSISDTGIGMSPGTRPRIFEPFFTTKAHGKGTGLGLSVVYGVVKGHRGFIHVESEEGRGAEFTTYFPVSTLEIENVPAPKEESHEVAGGNETILLVEDEPMLLDLLKLVLEEHGYTILAAMDGEEGVRCYRQYKSDIDLVLTDMGLPKLGGWEMFQKLREENPDVKVILASGFVDPDMKADLIEKGARDFVQKPYVPQKILRRIREVLDAK